MAGRVVPGVSSQEATSYLQGRQAQAHATWFPPRLLYLFEWRFTDEFVHFLTWLNAMETGRPLRLGYNYFWVV